MNIKLLVGGIISTVLGLFLALLFGTTSLLTCNRLSAETVTCTTQTLWFSSLPFSEQSTPLSIDAVDVLEECSAWTCQYHLRLANNGEGQIRLRTHNLADAERLSRVLQIFFFDQHSTTVAVAVARPVRTGMGYALLVLPTIAVGAVLLYFGFKAGRQHAN